MLFYNIGNQYGGILCSDIIIMIIMYDINKKCLKRVVRVQWY